MMNKERVSTLWIAATDYAKALSISYNERELAQRTKFAELVMQECLTVVEESNPHSSVRDIDEIYRIVETHFGVN
jgi:hypothetical protein